MQAVIVSVLALILSVLHSPTNANELYINQIGNNFYFESLQQGSGTYMQTTVIGDNNTLLLSQKDMGMSDALINLYGDYNYVTTIQEGGGNHSLNVELYNNGGPYNFILNQNSATDLNYSVTSYCTNLNGCSLYIVQQ